MLIQRHFFPRHASVCQMPFSRRSMPASSRLITRCRPLCRLFSFVVRAVPPKFCKISCRALRATCFCATPRQVAEILPRHSLRLSRYREARVGAITAMSSEPRCSGSRRRRKRPLLGSSVFEAMQQYRRAAARHHAFSLFFFLHCSRYAVSAARPLS